jgi:hypothetical protein
MTYIKGTYMKKEFIKTLHNLQTQKNIPIIGYSVHFPRIEDETKVSYKASINREFDNEVMEDDDNPETEEN